MALELKIDAYKKNIPLSFYDLKKQLPGLKNIDWIKAVPALSLQAEIFKLERSFTNFFRGSGFPKFRSKKRGQSISFVQDNTSIRQVSKTSFKLPKIGEVEVFENRITTAPIKTATIRKELNKYYLTVTFEQTPIHSSTNENQVGLDVGISNFAVLSDGTFIEHPHLFIVNQQKLRRQQRKLSRCKLRGKNWYKQVLKVQKLHQKVRRSREDFLHKLSTGIIKNNQLVAVEKLNIKGMVRSNLAKHISDSGWYAFSQMLKYKAELYGRTFIQVPSQYSSQECYQCGHVAAENRQSQSIFVCVKCGHGDHADLNASKNLLRRGQRLLAQSTDNSLRLAKELTLS